MRLSHAIAEPEDEEEPVRKSFLLPLLTNKFKQVGEQEN